MLINVFRDNVGDTAVILFRVGLFGAAFTGCITQALSAGVVVRGCLKPVDATDDDPKWGPRGWVFKGVIGSHLLVGMLTSVFYFDPLTIITAAQVTNGIILPVLVLCLTICINDPLIMKGTPQSDSWNLFLLPSLAMAFFIAFRTIIDILFGSLIDNDTVVITVAFLLAALSVTPMMVVFWKRRGAAEFETSDTISTDVECTETPLLPGKADSK